MDLQKENERKDYDLTKPAIHFSFFVVYFRKLPVIQTKQGLWNDKLKKNWNEVQGP